MDNMMKQMRVKFSGIEERNEGESSRDRDRKSPSLKTRSFKGDSRRGQNWYKGQSSSREFTYDYDSDYMESDEFQTAVAAAAFAVCSVEERKRSARGKRDESLNKSKKKQEDSVVSMSRRARERILSSSASNRMKNKEDDTVPISTPSRKSSELQEKEPQRANSPANIQPFFKKISTSFDKQQDKRSKPESGLASTSSSPKPTKLQPTFPTPEVNKKRSEPRLEDTKADVWEQTEMERIKERYDKVYGKILEWENERKAKAKKKLSSNKDESEKKRARALKNYKTDLEMIDQIVEGARKQADENRIKEEKRVKEKADTIRLTGKIPTKTCLCF